MAKQKAKNAKGVVYILTNPCFKENCIKIGKAEDLQARIATLNNTAIPCPFEPYAVLESALYEKCEASLHKIITRLTDLRINTAREFYYLMPDEALGIFKDFAPSIADAVLYQYIDGQPYQIYPAVSGQELPNQKKKREVTKENFRFSMIGLSAGDKIIFDPLNLEVEVADEKKISYDGGYWSLSGFVREFMPEEHRNTSGAYQGPLYFSYNGKTLKELREEYEGQADDEMIVEVELENEDK